MVFFTQSGKTQAGDILSDRVGSFYNGCVRASNCNSCMGIKRELSGSVVRVPYLTRMGHGFRSTRPEDEGGTKRTLRVVGRVFTGREQCHRQGLEASRVRTRERVRLQPLLSGFGT